MKLATWILLMPVLLWAEIDSTQNFQFQSAEPRRFEATNGISEGVLDDTLSRERPQADSRNVSSGREFKAADSESLGNQGKNVATATGISLIAAGVPMTASIIPSVVAAGLDLIAKGSMELAQAAATGKTEQQNGDQKRLLTQTYDEGANGGPQSARSQEGSSSANSPFQGFSPSEAASIRQQVLTPQLQSLLTERGINEDAFLESVLNGEISDIGSAARALGDFTDFSPEDLAKASAISAEQLGTASAEVKDKAGELAFVESADKTKETSAQNASNGSVAIPNLAQGGQRQNAGLDAGTNSNGTASGKAARSIASLSTNVAASAAGANGPDYLGQARAQMAGLLGQFKKGKESLKKIPESQLLKAGIYRPTSASSGIFSRANSFYQNFAKWRGNGRSP